MTAPQITFAILLAIGLLLNARDHGKLKTGKDNFWIGFTSFTILVAITYWGGFWGGAR